MAGSLWGEDFSITPPLKQQKKIIDKVTKPKKVTTTTEKVTKKSSKL